MSPENRTIYPDSNPSYNDAGTIGATSATNTATDAASQAKSKAANLGRAAAEKIDQQRSAAAGGLKSAASTLHEKADSLPGGDRVANIAHTAADKLASTSDYIRDHDVQTMMTDVERLVKNNPGPALLGAAVIGFLVARTFSSND
jgi:ElaB/YqjD/DUF883 family membrane-anchored ribosome-binding protein